MSRKHFVAVASALRLRYSVSSEGERYLLEGMARELASIFEQGSPNFDRARFLSAAFGREVSS